MPLTSPQSFGYTTWETQLLQSVTGVLQIITMITAAWIDRRYKQTILAMVAAVVPTIAGTIVLITVPFHPSKKVGLLLAYYVMISFWACSGLALSLVTRNVAGQTKKGVVIASNFVFWATGNSIGPQVFRAQDAPRYFLALAIILSCFVALEIVLLLLRTYYIWQNKSRDAKIASGEAVADTAHTHAFEDITDKVGYCCTFQLILVLTQPRKMSTSDTTTRFPEGMPGLSWGLTRDRELDIIQSRGSYMWHSMRTASFE